MEVEINDYLIEDLKNFIKKQSVKNYKMMK